MTKYPIKLGKKMGGVETAPPQDTKDGMYYPSLYLEWNDSYNLPDSGEMTVKFRKRSETSRTDSDGTRQTVELDITSIEDVEGTKGENYAPRENAGDALDKIRAALEEVDETDTPEQEAAEGE